MFTLMALVLSILLRSLKRRCPDQQQRKMKCSQGFKAREFHANLSFLLYKFDVSVGRTINNTKYIYDIRFQNIRGYCMSCIYQLCYEIFKSTSGSRPESFPKFKKKTGMLTNL